MGNNRLWRAVFRAVSQFLETDARERSRARARIALAVSAGTFAGCTWFAASPVPVRSDEGVLVDAQGRTLYTFDRDAHDKSACNAQCAVNWPPLHAGADAKPARETTARSSGRTKASRSTSGARTRSPATAAVTAWTTCGVSLDRDRKDGWTLELAGEPGADREPYPAAAALRAGARR